MRIVKVVVRAPGLAAGEMRTKKRREAKLPVIDCPMVVFLLLLRGRWEMVIRRSDRARLVVPRQALRHHDTT